MAKVLEFVSDASEFVGVVGVAACCVVPPVEVSEVPEVSLELSVTVAGAEVFCVLSATAADCGFCPQPALIPTTTTSSAVNQSFLVTFASSSQENLLNFQIFLNACHNALSHFVLECL